MEVAVVVGGAIVMVAEPVGGTPDAVTVIVGAPVVAVAVGGGFVAVAVGGAPVAVADGGTVVVVGDGGTAVGVQQVAEGVGVGVGSLGTYGSPRIKTSVALLVSPATRFVASEWKATAAPEVGSDAYSLLLLPSPPVSVTDPRVITPVGIS